MIKINLNRSRMASGPVDGETIAFEDASGGSIRDVLVKLLVICLGTVGLVLYERQNSEQLAAELVVVNGQLQQLKTQVAQKNAELGQLADIEPQAKALNDKLKVLRQYSKQRITELQSLDFMQSIIPERVWL